MRGAVARLAARATASAWAPRLVVPCRGAPLEAWRVATATAAPRSFCTLSVTFVKDGDETVIDAKNGQTILEVAHEHDLDIEGACGGECACSTCHVVLEQKSYDAIPEPDDDEADMLDLAANVTDTSRLGCQVKLQKGRDDNIRIQIPAGVVNLLS